MRVVGVGLRGGGVLVRRGRETREVDGKDGKEIDGMEIGKEIVDGSGGPRPARQDGGDDMDRKIH